MSLVIKSPIDNRTYESFVLKENNLKVFMINDEKAPSCCVAMFVNVGYLADTYSGMAHFLEHMLFMGTKKYPKESYFNEFILTHGGSSNAFTTHDTTCYYYTTQEEILNESLDIFSQFFIEPLLNPHSVSKEVNAVNDEHEKNMNDDAWRHEEIIKKACNNKHPYKNFGTGNNKTLVNDDKLASKVREFYEKYYSPEIMTLFVYCNKNISDNIKSLFSQVKPSDKFISFIDKNVKGQIFNPPQTIHLVPIKNTERMTILWELPFEHITTLHFLVHILGHGGKNTLKHILTKTGYISDFEVELGDKFGDKCIFRFDLILTQDGGTDAIRKKIINCIYHYIDLLKQSQLEQLYNEFIAIEKNNFTYNLVFEPEDVVLDLVRYYAYHKMDLNKLLSYKTEINDYNDVHNNIQKIFTLMTPNKSILLISSPLNKCSKVEKHYGIKYEINKEFIEVNYDCIKDIKKDFKIPEINKYMPSNFKLIDIEYKNTKPKKIKSDIDLFWLPITTNYDIVKIPIVSVYCKVDIPNIIQNCETYTKTLLYINCVMAMIKHELQMCHMIGFVSSVVVQESRLYISVEGYSSKIYEVCKLIVDALMAKNIDDVIYNLTLFQYKKADENAIHKNPYIKVNDLFLKYACCVYYDNHDRLKCYDNITKTSVVNIMDDSILNKTHVTMLVCGNMDDIGAIKLSKLFNVFVSKQKYEPNLVMLNNMKDIVSAQDPCIMPSETEYEKNVAVSYYIEIFKCNVCATPDWIYKYCMLQLLENMIGDKYFDALRTKEKFGYIVNAKCTDVGDPNISTYYYRYLVQSPKRTPDEIIKRTKKFIKQFVDVLNNMSDDIFNDYVNGCVTPLTFDMNNVSDLAQYYFSQIEQKYYKFDMNELLVSVYKKIRKAELIDFYKITFMGNVKSIIVGYNRI